MKAFFTAPIDALINHFMIPFLELIYNNLIPNYGIAIILLTVLIKVILFPLTQKQFESMKAMQKLQPKMKDIRDKYKKDPQKLQVAMMEMYKQENVHPFGGCLPMLIQLPILFALYFAVTGEAFNDLVLQAGSNPGFTSFWLSNLTMPDNFYILPLLIGGLTFLTQKMTPMSGDSSQQKILAFMPVLMTVVCFRMPAGVLIYWTVSQFISVIQQFYIYQDKEKANA